MNQLPTSVNVDIICRRLLYVFRQVFPNLDLNEEQCVNMEIENTPSWDSLKTIELIEAIECEFGIVLSFSTIIEAQSFRDYLAAIDLSLAGC